MKYNFSSCILGAFIHHELICDVRNTKNYFLVLIMKIQIDKLLSSQIPLHLLNIWTEEFGNLGTLWRGLGSQNTSGYFSECQPCYYCLPMVQLMIIFVLFTSFFASLYLKQCTVLSGWGKKSQTLFKNANSLHLPESVHQPIQGTLIQNYLHSKVEVGRSFSLNKLWG